MKKMLLFMALAMVILLSACQSMQKENKEEAKPDQVYQVALLQSLTLGGYDGLISVKELKEHGDIGIGTFEGVNGEMIVLDGVVYQALYDGSVTIASDSETVPYATVGYMEDDITTDIEARDFAELRDKLNELVAENGKNEFYFIRIDGNAKGVDVRSELKQLKPYKPLDVALSTDQREFIYKDEKGMIVGLYCPAYMVGLNTPGWHFHFVSEDKKRGGHLLALDGLSGKLSMDKMVGFEMICPETADFNLLNLGQDQSERIHSVEQKAK